MEKENIKDLINSWDVVNQALAPSEPLSTAEPASLREMAELSILSGRREYWESIVSLAGYAESMPEENEQVIENLFNALENNASAPQVNDYLEYAETVVTVSQDTLQSASRALSLVLGPQGVSPLIGYLTRLEICLELFRDDPVKLRECLQK